MNKFTRTLVTINGIIIPLFIGFLVFGIIRNPPSEFREYEEPESIIVGDELEKAKRDSLALQGISYETPQSIYNSTNMYMPISIMTYEEARQFKKDVASAGDMSPAFAKYVNVLFLDKDYKVIGQLLDKKASILDIQINRGQYSYRTR